MAYNNDFLRHVQLSVIKFLISQIFSFHLNEEMNLKVIQNKNSSNF